MHGASYVRNVQSYPWIENTTFARTCSISLCDVDNTLASENKAVAH